MNARSLVRTVKNLVTMTVLLAAPSAFMMQPAPMTASEANTEVNAPTWNKEIAQAFPRCVEIVEGIIAPRVVVILQSADAVRMTTDEAFAINGDDERANDVWVVGTCA